MTNQDISFNVDCDRSLQILPEGTIVFGGKIRDLISGEKNTNDVDILVPKEDSENDFIRKIYDKINHDGFNIVDINCKTCTNKYQDFFNHIKLRLLLSKDESIFVVNFDIIKPSDYSAQFISDFDVNSLYGVIKEGKLNVLGSIFTDTSTEDVINCINERKANSIFSPSASEGKKEWRTHKIISKGYRANKCPPATNFMSVESIITDAIHFIQNQKTNSDKEKPMTNSNAANNVSFVDRLKKNAVEGAYQAAARVAIDQFIEATLLAMRKAGVDEVSIALASTFAKSDVGTAVVSAFIGMGVPYIPVEALQNNQIALKIADKCVENAAADTGQLLAEVASNFIKPALEAAANSLSNVKVNPIAVQLEQPKVRVKPVELVNEDTSLEELQALEVALMERRNKLQNKVKL